MTQADREERVAKQQPLNPNAQKWVEALRSGKYKQGKDRLATEDGKFCCLGVLCEVAMENGVPLNKIGLQYDGKTEILPEPVKVWAGLTDVAGWYGDSEGLAAQNDNGKSFLEIADIIERHPKELFAEVTA